MRLIFLFSEYLWRQLDCQFPVIIILLPIQLLRRLSIKKRKRISTANQHTQIHIICKKNKLWYAGKFTDALAKKTQ